MSIMDKRYQAVIETISTIREIEYRQTATRAALDEIKDALIGLASRTDLFPVEHFPIPAGRTGRIYRLSEDPDHRFALYASAGAAGKGPPPPHHTTLAAVTGGRRPGAHHVPRPLRDPP